MSVSRRARDILAIPHNRKSPDVSLLAGRSRVIAVRMHRAHVWTTPEANLSVTSGLTFWRVAQVWHTRPRVSTYLEKGGSPKITWSVSETADAPSEKEAP
jgi:hypothetical protein